MDFLITLKHLTAFLLGGLIVAQALVIGYGVLSPLRRRWGPPGSDGPSVAIALTLGLGLLSHGLWLLSAVGSLTGLNLFRTWMLWVSFAATLIIFRRACRDMWLALSARWKRDFKNLVTVPAYQPVLIFTIAIFVLFRLCTLAVVPSSFYDILEYHEPIVRQILGTGSLAPIEGIAYSKMPWGAHLLYAWASLIIGDLAPSALRVMNVWLALCAAFLVAVGIGKWRLGMAFRFLAAGVFLIHPITQTLLYDAYVGMAQTVFVTAGLICVIRALRLPNRLDPILAMTFMGFALGCKYPVAGVALMPVLILSACMLPREALPAFLRRRNHFIRIAGWMLLGGMIAGAAYSPWALRGLIIGDSFFPPVSGRWIGEAPTPQHAALEDFMRTSHAIEFPPGEGFIQRLGGNVSDVGWWIFLAVLLAAAVPSVERRTRFVGGVVLLGYLVWCLAPRGESRFLAPLLGGMAIVSVGIARDATRRWFGTAGYLILIPLAAWTLLNFFIQTREILSPGAYGAIIRRTALSDYPVTQFRRGMMGEVTGDFYNTLQHSCQPGDKVLMLYEARAAMVPPETSVRINTVFDPSPLWLLLQNDAQADPEAILEKLRLSGYTIIAINEAELARLLGAYPANAAYTDKNFQNLNKFISQGNAPSLERLAFKQYYPPHYYFSRDSQDLLQTQSRLEALMQDLWQHPGPYSESIGPARLMIRRIATPK